MEIKFHPIAGREGGAEKAWAKAQAFPDFDWD
jgi:hypothetical protein